MSDNRATANAPVEQAIPCLAGAITAGRAKNRLEEPIFRKNNSTILPQANPASIG